MSNGRRTRSAWVAAAAVAIAAVSTAAPAVAQETVYLSSLQERFRFLSPEQLLSEGYRACAAVEQGVPTWDTVEMVKQDLGVATGVAMEIVSAATVNLDCRTT